MTNENALVEVLQPTAPAPEGFKEWLETGRGLYEQRKALDWQCADWLAEGQQKFPEQMALVLPMLATDPIEQKQLTRSAKIAASIPVAQRCTALTFDHHRHVADLPVEERLVLLGRAQSENLSARAMRIIALERKAALGVGNTEFEDDDWEYHELMAIVRAWNRARPDARQSFYDMAGDAELGVVEA
ncbi:MAG: hypothetical protein V4657_12370 [Pseudomonadota bacterium]